MPTFVRSRLSVLGFLTLASTVAAMPAQAQGSLVVYCARAGGMVPRRWSTAFERETGIKVSMTRKSSGEIYAQLKAEAANPRGDIWWGGTGDPHLQAAEEGLTDRVQVAEAWRAAGLGGAPVGAVEEAAPSASIPARSASATTPSSEEEGHRRAEMLGRPARPEVQGRGPGRRPELVGHVLHAARDARAADGRGQGLRVPQGAAQEHQPVHQVGRRAGARRRPRRDGWSASRSSTTPWCMAVAGAPVKIVAPCEGTGYEIGSCRSSRARKNLENAKKWYDWALTPEAQEHRRAKPRSYQVPSNKSAPIPPEAPKLAEIKLIDYDFAKYGSSAERTPPAGQVGQRGEEPAEVTRDAGAPQARLCGMSRTARLWLALGWAGFALLPWHLSPGDWLRAGLRLFATQGPRSAASLALTGNAWWLAADRPAACCWRRSPLVDARSATGGSDAADCGGAARTRLIIAQGFAIGLNGWSWAT